ncbi:MULTISPECIES: hypothetical protein [Xanthomonas]|uniref:hypothetical protein n=1 Tax=Xanthomonas TaxID=338 RepID=UPI0012FF220A|nr:MULTISPECIES: hypothetical protein [Xanthomonas]
MKITADGKDSWKLVGAPEGAKLCRVTIIFPPIKSGAGGVSIKFTEPKVNIRIIHDDGRSESISNVDIEWS